MRKKLLELKKRPRRESHVQEENAKDLPASWVRGGRQATFPKRIRGGNRRKADKETSTDKKSPGGCVSSGNAASRQRGSRETSTLAQGEKRCNANWSPDQVRPVLSFFCDITGGK